MAYLSLAFAAFIAAAILAFYLLPVRFRSVVLLVMSLLFYASYDLRYMLYLLFVSVSTFYCARKIAQRRDGKVYLVCTVVLNASVWLLIKQFSWAVNLLNTFIGFSPANIVLPEFFRLAPVGISYYMLMAISYIVDVYKGNITCEKSYGKYLLYLSYFPAVVQGPISRYSDLVPQFSHQKKFHYENFSYHSVQIIIGLIKKIVLADRLAVFVSYCFGNIDQLSGSLLYLGAVGFAFQLYADFSGCVDICLGVSGYFGIDLVPNFSSPYHARSIKEFWNRWHLSLSHWLRDYVYIPMGGNRHGKFRKYLNLLATFTVSGIWHGAGFTYLIWGWLHAIYQIVGGCTVSLREKLKHKMRLEKDSASEVFYQRFLTFQLTLFAWIFFRAESVAVAFRYVWKIFTEFNFWVLMNESVYSDIISGMTIIVVSVHIALILKLDQCKLNGIDPVVKIRELHIFLRYGIYVLLILDLLLLGSYGGYDASAFLYGGF